MAEFTDLVRRLLDEGSVRLRQPPLLHPDEHEPVLELLSGHFRRHQFDVMGDPIPFAPAVSLRAVELLTWSCWFLLNRSEPAHEIERRLPTLAPARSAAEHLSADLIFRFLPQVHRRARAGNPTDPLTVRLGETLRRWPLSGVLADLDDPPLVPIDFDHPGLRLLYAERLAERSCSAQTVWMPEGPTFEYVELVFSERKLPLLLPERIPT
jgi:AcrR family transcriptional regulator